MSNQYFELRNQEKIGDIQASFFVLKKRGGKILKQYIKDRIQSGSARFNNLLEDYTTLSEEDKAHLLENHKKLTTPKKHAISAFDVKRSTVTEFMAEFLLEKEYRCIFFEETNKKINKSIVDTDKHTSGIDVVGFQENNHELKFVIAEVKTSSEHNTLCRQSKRLKQDILNIIDFNNERVFKEIMQMLNRLMQINSNSLERYIAWLIRLINNYNSKEIIIKNLIIFPFLIRNNRKFSASNSLDDFQHFSELDVSNTAIEGVLWAVNTSINDFVSQIYENT